jgi:hypothetical protein
MLTWASLYPRKINPPPPGESRVVGQFETDPLPSPETLTSIAVDSPTPRAVRADPDFTNDQNARPNRLFGINTTHNP